MGVVPVRVWRARRGRARRGRAISNRHGDQVKTMRIHVEGYIFACITAILNRGDDGSECTGRRITLRWRYARSKAQTRLTIHPNGKRESRFVKATNEVPRGNVQSPQFHVRCDCLRASIGAQSTFYIVCSTYPSSRNISDHVLRRDNIERVLSGTI